MLQVEKTSVPPGFTSCTAAASILRWYAAVDCSSRSVCLWTSLQVRAGGGVVLGRAVRVHTRCTRRQLARLPMDDHKGLLAGKAGRLGAMHAGHACRSGLREHGHRMGGCSMQNSTARRQVRGAWAGEPALTAGGGRAQSRARRTARNQSCLAGTRR